MYACVYICLCVCTKASDTLVLHDIWVFKMWQVEIEMCSRDKIYSRFQNAFWNGFFRVSTTDYSFLSQITRRCTMSSNHIAISCCYKSQYFTVRPVGRCWCRLGPGGTVPLSVTGPWGQGYSWKGGCFPIEQVGADMENPKTVLLNYGSRHTHGVTYQIFSL